MKKTLLITYFTFMITMVFSQTGFTVYPASASLDITNPNEAEYVSKGYVVNHSDAEITLRWVKEVQSKPMAAEAAICDNVLCYEPFVNQSEFTIAKGDSSNFDFHYYPNGASGPAVYRVMVQEVGNLENKADVTFTMNEVATSAFGFASTEEIRVYPNPATEYFSVDGLDRLKEVIVYNLVGQEVKRFNASLKAKYDISELMRGLYLVRLVDQSEKVVKTVRLSKR
ncbi:MAG TPA: T9SS type A sorting domain-containing protein [Membranihabitans sp.]|nr:T9SS type A sorting domain-containing protein [Membranihabitans sp.]